MLININDKENSKKLEYLFENFMEWNEEFENESNTKVVKKTRLDGIDEIIKDYNDMQNSLFLVRNDYFEHEIERIDESSITPSKR
jgi:hypothetical protein